MRALTETEIELGGAVANAFSEQFGPETAVVNAEFDGIDVGVVVAFDLDTSDQKSVAIYPVAMLLDNAEAREHLDELDLPNLDFVTARDQRDMTTIEAAVMVTDELLDHLDPGEGVETVTAA